MAKKEKNIEEVLESDMREPETNGIEISEDVVSVIAGKAITDTPGVFDMAGGFAGGISEVFSGKKNLSKGIRVDIEGSTCRIDVNIIVEYGTRIPDVAFDIQNRVKNAVENMTGLKVEEVNVHVQGVNTDETKADDKKEEAKPEKKTAAKKSTAKKTTTKKTTKK